MASCATVCASQCQDPAHAAQTLPRLGKSPKRVKCMIAGQRTLSGARVYLLNARDRRREGFSARGIGLTNKAKVASSRRQAGPSKNRNKRTPVWRKPAAWLGGLLTVVLGGVLVSVLSMQANRVLQPSNRTPSSAREVAGTNPLRIVSEEPLNLESLWSYSFPSRILLDQSQLNHINALLSSAINNPLTGRLPGYFSSRGGYPVTLVNTQVVVQNNSPKPVRILSIYAVKSCGPPLAGTLFFAPGQAGESSVELGFNLDVPDGEARVSDGLHMVSASSPAYFSKYTINIAPGKQQVLSMYATTTRYRCSFRYRVTLLNGDEKEYQLIGNGGKPFWVSALAGFSKYSVIYAAGATSPDPRGAWARVNPDKYQG